MKRVVFLVFSLFSLKSNVFAVKEAPLLKKEAPLLKKVLKSNHQKAIQEKKRRYDCIHNEIIPFLNERLEVLSDYQFYRLNNNISSKFDEYILSGDKEFLKKAFTKVEGTLISRVMAELKKPKLEIDYKEIGYLVTDITKLRDAAMRDYIYDEYDDNDNRIPWIEDIVDNQVFETISSIPGLNSVRDRLQLHFNDYKDSGNNKDFKKFFSTAGRTFARNTYKELESKGTKTLSADDVAKHVNPFAKIVNTAQERGIYNHKSVVNRFEYFNNGISAILKSNCEKLEC